MGETRHRRTVTLPLATDFRVGYERDQGFPSGSVVKNPPATQETQEMWISSLGLEDILEEENVNPL